MKEKKVFEMSAETREAAHMALEAVLDKIDNGEIEASFFVNNRLLDVNARRREGKIYDTGWDMKETFYGSLSQTDVKTIMDKLDRVEGRKINGEKKKRAVG